MSRFRLKMTLGTLICALVIATAPDASASSNHGRGHGHGRPTAAEYHDLWRTLWEDHITWTRMVILGIFKDLPCTDSYVARLLDNPGDMADALRPFYGNQAADRFGELVTEHLTIAAELLQAAKAGDTDAFDDANRRWYDNGEEIAAFLTGLDSRAWPRRETERMWEEHLDATLREAVAVLHDDCAGDVEAYDQVHDLALEMADSFSNGVFRKHGAH